MEKHDIQIVIPALSLPWCVEDCIESMGETDIPVLVVDNSEDQEISKYADGKFPKNVSVVNQGGNIGIAASWNLGLNCGKEHTLICSQTVRFAHAEYPRRTGEWGIEPIANAIKSRSNEYGLTFGDQGFHLISIRSKTVDEIGEFDENFIAYGEDDDYGHRMNLAGISFGSVQDISGFWSIGYGIQKRMNDTIKRMNINKSRMTDYYTHKWGDPHPGTFNTPFNNPNNGLDYWPEVNLV